MKLRQFRRSERLDADHMSGCAIIDADWIQGVVSDLWSAVHDLPTGETKQLVARAAMRLVRDCHFGKRAIGLMRGDWYVRELEKMAEGKK